MNADDLIRLLDELGKRLGPTGEYVFSLAVRQVYVEAIVSFVALLLFVTLAILGVRASVIWFRRHPDGEDAELGELELTLFLGSLVAAGVTVVLIITSIGKFIDVLNPEYAALRALLGTVTK